MVKRPRSRKPAPSRVIAGVRSGPELGSFRVYDALSSFRGQVARNRSLTDGGKTGRATINADVRQLSDSGDILVAKIPVFKE